VERKPENVGSQKEDWVMGDIGKVKAGGIGILFLTDVFRIMAGSERNIVNLLRGMDRNQFKIILACFLSGPLCEAMQKEGYEIEWLRQTKIYSWDGLKKIFYLIRFIKKKNISLIVTYHESSDIFGLILSKISKVPIISNRRDMGFNMDWKHKIFYKLFGRHFDCTIAVCNAVREEILRKKWFRQDEIRIIHNGVDTGIFKQLEDRSGVRKEIGIDDSDLVVGAVANLRKIKGIRFFIEAASIICRRVKKVKFIVIGADMNEPGSTIKDLEQLAENLQVKDHISFLGRRDDANELMQIVDVGVLPSLSEGFSNVILEFMSCGKPVVATDVGGNREAVAHGETGFLVAPADSSGLAEAVLRLIENEETRKQFGAAGRWRAEGCFGLGEMINEYQKAFLSVISSRTPIKK
jgi:glycosyltransferase involved in cell wall biosynthesis